jgi:hypothetical protein
MLPVNGNIKSPYWYEKTDIYKLLNEGILAVNVFCESDPLIKSLKVD